MKLNISNLLTLARILVIPVIVICIYLKSPFYGWVAFVLFCLASITDYFDGYIARIRNEITNFGTINAASVVINNAKLYVNRAEGFIGYGLKKDEYIYIEKITC